MEIIKNVRAVDNQGIHLNFIKGKPLKTTALLRCILTPCTRIRGCPQTLTNRTRTIGNVRECILTACTRIEEGGKL
jgi:hypothetical protein